MSGDFCFLNVSSSAISPLGTGSNVNIIYDSGNKPGTVWYIGSLSNNVQIQSTLNMRYRLGANASTWNCDVQLKNYAANVNFKLVSGTKNTYRIQLVSNPSMYLTDDKGRDAIWTAFDESSAGQKWVIHEMSCEYVHANDWLRMKTTPSATGGRNVSMPTVAPFEKTFLKNGVTVKYTFQFNDKYNWATFQPNMGTTKINPEAYKEIKRVTGKVPVVNEGAVAGLTDEAGRYWIAVGPNVVNPNHKPNQIPSPQEMYAHGTLDVVVKDVYGTTFYIPAIVGGTKAHTYQNGIIQTWISFASPSETSNPGGNYNGVVCAEFINVKQENFSGMQEGFFFIEKIIFYPS